jgi:hypothetical protein
MSPDSIDYHIVQTCLLDAVVIVFLVSGTAKLLGLQTFRFGLQLLPFMTSPLATVVSIGLPLAELAVAIGLFLNQAWAKYASIGMLVLFSGVASLAVLMGRQVPCGCFGQLDGQTLSMRTVFRNGLLILVIVATLGLESRAQWPFSLWPSALALLMGLSLVQAYQNHKSILILQRAKLL